MKIEMNKIMEQILKNQILIMKELRTQTDYPDIEKSMLEEINNSSMLIGPQPDESRTI